MTTRPTESVIEDFAIKLFERLGYDYIHARMATDCSQLKKAVMNGRRFQLSEIAGQLKQMAKDMRWGLTLVPTPEKCLVVQATAAMKADPSSPEKCYIFSGFLVSMQA